MDTQINENAKASAITSLWGVSPLFCDYNATTPLAPGLKSSLGEAFGEHWFNPSSPYFVAAKESSWIRSFRHRLSQLSSGEVKTVFTSSATEAINQAIYSLSQTLSEHSLILISDVEHSAVNEAALRWFPNRVKKLSSQKLLRKDFDELQSFVEGRYEVVLFLQAANNETGAIFPIQSIRASFPELKVVLDGSQVFGKFWSFIDFLADADAFIISPHKFYGPKGIGILNWGSRLGSLLPLIVGGGQEHGFRSGTENSPILYLAHQWLHCLPDLLNEQMNVADFTKKFETYVLRNLHGSFLVTSAPRIPNTVALGIDGLVSESAIAALDSEGIMVSSGSACRAGTREPSQTYLAFGLDWEQARSVLRFSFGIPNLALGPEELAEKVISVLKRVRA